MPGPFDLNDTATYAAWRERKLADHPRSLAELVVGIDDPRSLSAAERAALADRIARCNMAIYAGRTREHADKEIVMVQKMFFEPLIVIEAEQQVEEQAPMTINFFTLFMPGFTVMFAFFLVGAIGQSIFNEKDSGRIRRLLVAPIHKGTLIAGKMLAFGILIVLQVIILLGLPAVLFDMGLGSSPLGLLLVTIALALTVTSFGLMVAALSKTGKQADSIGTLLGFLLAGLGGCIFMSIHRSTVWIPRLDLFPA